MTPPTLGESIKGGPSNEHAEGALAWEIMSKVWIQAMDLFHTREPTKGEVAAALDRLAAIHVVPGFWGTLVATLATELLSLSTDRRGFGSIRWYVERQFAIELGRRGKPIPPEFLPV